MYPTDPANAESVGAVQGEIFGAIRPAAPMIVTAAPLRDEWRVEFEAEALITP